MSSSSLFHRAWSVLAFFVCLASSLSAGAPVPPLLNYQGQLTDSGGNALNGTYAMIFTLYNDPVAGTNVWFETQNSVTVTKGLFNVILGSSTPINIPALNVNDNLWLAVRVSPDATDMTPRHQVLPSAYAWNARSLWGAVPGTAAGNLAQLDNFGHLSPSTLPVPFDLSATITGGDVLSARNGAGDANAEGIFAAGYTGVSATSNNSSGTGVYGCTGPSDFSNSRGVWGQANAGYGVMGSSVTGAGVIGQGTGGGTGVIGQSSSTGIGVQGSGYYGLYGDGTSAGCVYGVYTRGNNYGVYSFGNSANYYSYANNGQYGYYGYANDTSTVGYFYAGNSGRALYAYSGGTQPAVEIEKGGSAPALKVTSTLGASYPAVSVTAASGMGIFSKGYKYNSAGANGVYGYGYVGLVGVGAYTGDDSATGVSACSEDFTYGTGLYATGFYGMKVSASYTGLIIGGETSYGGHYLDSPSYGIRVSAVNDAITVGSASYGLVVANATTWCADLAGSNGVRVNALNTGLDITSTNTGVYGLKINASGTSSWGLSISSYYGGSITTAQQGLGVFNNGTAYAIYGIDYNTTTTGNYAAYFENRSAASDGLMAVNYYNWTPGSTGAAATIRGRLKFLYNNAMKFTDVGGVSSRSAYCQYCNATDVAIVTPGSLLPAGVTYYATVTNGYIYIYTSSVVAAATTWNYVIIGK